MVAPHLHTHLFMYYLYILKSEKDHKLYFGCTSDLKKRIKQHNDGRSQATRARRPFRLVYYEAYLSLEDARRREARLKKYKSAYTQLKKRIECSLHMD